jgi:outer membrane beta-barrel protein
MKRTLRAIVLISVFMTNVKNRAFSLDLDPNEIRGKSSKESVTVLQNRYFLKSFRPEAGLMVGGLLDEAYLETKTYGARSGLFLNEWLGIEVAVSKAIVRDSEDRKALRTLKYAPLNTSGDGVAAGSNVQTIVSPDPEVNAVHGMSDFSAIAAPFYGKLNFMNRFIIYTDLYGALGVSRVETDQGDKMAIAFGAGERFYIGKDWSLRVDFKNRSYNESRAGAQSRKNSYSFDFGGSFFFN